MSFLDFEHRLIKHLREEFKDLSGQDVYVACSGGADSVALLTALSKVQAVFKYKLNLLHIHHGEADTDVQNRFRSEAAQFCKKLFVRHDFPFHIEKSEKKLVSEEDCRDFRLGVFERFPNVFLGQHKDDLTETLILRLIRGTGSQGFSEPFSRDLHRPFLKLFHKVEILEYLEKTGQGFLCDPSNSDGQYLRNWVRNEWLPLLEKKRGVKGLATSLQLISEEISAQKEDFFNEVLFLKETSLGNPGRLGSFSSSYWLNLNRFQKQSTIAHVLLKTIKTGYTKGQVDEIVKNLDVQGRTTTFHSGGLSWDKAGDIISFKKA